MDIVQVSPEFLDYPRELLHDHAIIVVDRFRDLAQRGGKFRMPSRGLSMEQAWWNAVFVGGVLFAGLSMVMVASAVLSAARCALAPLLAGTEPLAAGKASLRSTFLITDTNEQINCI